MGRLLYGLFGAGGAARAVLPMMQHGLIIDDQSCQTLEDDAPRDLCLIETEPRSERVDGFSVFDEASFFGQVSADRRFCIAIGSPIDRRRIAERVDFANRPTFSLLARNSIVETSHGLGRGAIVCANSYISVNVEIGNSFFMNIGSTLEHDCVVGDFVTFSPGVVCSGNVHVGDDVFIGAGAVIINGSEGSPLVIGRGAVVGAGAVVTRSVGSGQTVVGNPARVV